MPGGSGPVRPIKSLPVGWVKIGPAAEKLSWKAPAKYQKVAQSESLLPKPRRWQNALMANCPLMRLHQLLT